jgi:hypothetical protein
MRWRSVFHVLTIASRALIWVGSCTKETRFMTRFTRIGSIKILIFFTDRNTFSSLKLIGWVARRASKGAGQRRWVFKRTSRTRKRTFYTRISCSILLRSWIKARFTIWNYLDTFLIFNKLKSILTGQTSYRIQYINIFGFACSTPIRTFD